MSQIERNALIFQIYNRNNSHEKYCIFNFKAGDDQVDVKYYKNHQIQPMTSSTSSSLSSSSGFNFLCKNPDCWQINDLITKSPEEILLEWSPSDRSLFSCFIDSFPSNYCFIAYMMRNKSCGQVTLHLFVNWYELNCELK